MTRQFFCTAESMSNLAVEAGKYMLETQQELPVMAKA